MRGRYLTNVPQNEIFISRKEYKNLLRFALRYAIVYIQRESHRSGSTHIMTNYYLMRGMPSLLRIVAAISFSLVNLIKQIRKGDNEYPNLD